MRNVSTLLRPTMSLAALFIFVICLFGISAANVQAAGTTFVNDNWNFVTDFDASNSLTLGDVVRNDNDTINAGTITKIYGLDAFGIVTSGAFTGSAAGSATIDDAISNTNVAGTVNVLEGVYDQMATVNKSIRLHGAQAGVDARTRMGGGESIIRGAGSPRSTSFYVTASNVEIDGFTVQETSSSNQFGCGILLGVGTSGTKVRNNIIQDSITGLYLANGGASQAVIKQNLFRNNNLPGLTSGAAIYTNQFVGGTVSNVLIDSNTFVGHTAPAIFLTSTASATPATNITVSNNLFDANSRSLTLFNLTSSQITGNTMRNSTSADLLLFEGVSGLTITRNVLENGAGRALRIRNIGTGALSATNVSFRLNSVSGYTDPATLLVEAGAYTGILDATNTWWGDITGPTIASNPGGTGQTIVDPSDVVDFQPWLTYAPDADADTPGVQIAACAGISFAAPKFTNFGNIQPFFVTTGDFNGDGKLDLATTNLLAHTVSILIGNGQGMFGAPATFGVGTLPYSVTTGDFNGDGKLDMVTANRGTHNVSILLGDGLGGVAPAANFGVGFGPEFVTSGDFNADGRLDVATANAISNSVSILLGDGLGGFASVVNFGAGGTPSSVATADLNGDGKLDLATANSNSNNVSILLGNGLGGFGAQTTFGVGTMPSSVATGDFNGDGKLDVVTSNRGSNNISILLGDGTGAFAAAVTFGVGLAPESVTTGDLNGDGKLDVATANNDSDTVSILLGDGLGGFGQAVNFADGDSTSSVTTGDLNGDGRLDVASANSGTSNVGVLLNSCSTNTAPVAANDGYAVNEDPASSLTGNVLDNDTDGQSNTLSATLTVAAPSGLTFNPNGSFSYTPPSNFNGIVQFTYKASDGSLDSNVATVTITVNPVNDAPQVSATPKTQPNVQYSDAIQTVTINASDIETSANNLTIAFSYARNGGASVAGLPGGMIQGGSGGGWTVSGKAGVLPGSYVVTAAVTDTGDGSSLPITSTDTFTIVVTKEDVIAVPRTSNPVSMQVASPGGTASGTTAQFCFDISEIVDGSPGDISLITGASVQISAVGGGSGAGTITAPWVSITNAGARVACFSLILTNTPPNAFEVTLVIGSDYYTGSGTTAFVVFDPSAGFASGGGWIINPNTGYRANYGVNVKYLKNGNAQGSILYVEHRPDGDYKVKSTSLNSRGGFAIVPITGGAEAQIAGKANYVVNDVGTGNYSFIVRMIDKGTPGVNDQFGLKLIDPVGQVMNDFTFSPVLLGGGNNQVPKK